MSIMLTYRILKLFRKNGYVQSNNHSLDVSLRQDYVDFSRVLRLLAADAISLQRC